MAPGISLDDRNAWDDTALIDSWDEALAEYKKYYSIQTQGKRLEDFLSEEELGQLREEHGDLIEEIEPRSSNADPDDHADGKSAGGLNVEANGDGDVSMDVSQAEEPMASMQQAQSGTAEMSRPHQDGPLAASVPQAMFGTVQDENLKNLMMSWYYAGYYTGLHTGQQQAASKEAQK